MNGRELDSKSTIPMLMKTLNLIYPNSRFYTLISSVFFAIAPTGLFPNLPYLLLYTVRFIFIPRVTHPTHLPPQFPPLNLPSSDSYLNVPPTTAFHHRQNAQSSLFLFLLSLFLQHFLLLVFPKWRPNSSTLQ